MRAEPNRTSVDGSGTSKLALMSEEIATWFAASSKRTGRRHIPSLGTGARSEHELVKRRGAYENSISSWGKTKIRENGELWTAVGIETRCVAGTCNAATREQSVTASVGYGANCRSATIARVIVGIIYTIIGIHVIAKACYWTGRAWRK